ncbi:hypothetical protein PAXRUDRAFT_136030, partial [Paxillus rubicundulus Ve08.2h10]
DSKGIPKSNRAPANPTLISAFLSTLAGLYSGNTISNYLHGVRAWHIIHGQKWALIDKEVAALLKAVTSLAPPSSKQPAREPYTINIITLIRAQLDLDSPLHTAAFTCLTTTFFATARVSEFTLATLSSFDPKLHIRWADISIVRNHQGLEVHNFRLLCTKSSPSGEDINWAKQQLGPSDPFTALENHFRVNDPPTEGPLFTYRHSKGHRPLTKKKFLSVLSSAAKGAGIKPLQGHGIRIGSTLEYLLRNVPFEAVKVKERWASDTFLTYLCRHTQILAPYMQAQPAIHKSFLRYTIPPVWC